MPQKAKILFLAANPKDAVELRLAEERREVEQRILLVQKKDMHAHYFFSRNLPTIACMLPLGESRLCH